MNEPTFLPDDPRLTAYALGELEGDERRAVEAALKASPALRATVAEIRATAQQLEAAFATEAAEAPAASEQGTVPFEVNGHPLRDAEPARGHELYATHGDAEAESRRAYAARGAGGKLIRFPQFYYIAGGLAVAGFAVMVSLHQEEFAVKEQARAESLRVAMQKREQSARTNAPAGTVMMERSAGIAEAVVDASVASAPEAQPGSFTAGGLSLLDQAQMQPSMDVSALAPALPPFSAERKVATRREADGTSPSSDDVVRNVSAAAGDKRLVAAASGGILLGSTAPAAREESRPLTLSAFRVSGEITAPSTRSLDARYAPSGGLDLYPGPRRVPSEPGWPPAPVVTHHTESYSHIRDNSFLGALQNPFSTFSIDVDTASFANVRRFLAGRKLPPPDAVRIEELLNYFSYRYPAPTGTAPFAASLEVAEAPWAPAHRLVRIGLKGREVPADSRPAANLVFLLDVSGSMNQPNKLPLVKASMRMLLGKLRPDDRVAIVTYAGNSGLALPSMPVARSREILDALDALTPGGSTNGAMGIQLAYDIAKANFAADGVNRVILCTDGDFNVGVTSRGDLVRLVEEKARDHVFLTVLGFGMGNLKDDMLEQLADKGNGHYGYIDGRREAEKLLVDEVSSTLVTIAKDVKIQVEFNPAKVASYRLIGYENRVLAKEDFNNDKVDAGEIGAGHTVTALYEIVPVGADDGTSETQVASVDELRYQRKPAAAPDVPGAVAGELLTVKVRYKEPTGDVSRKLEFPLTDLGTRFVNASVDFRFAAAVAQFGMMLRKSEHRGAATMGDVITWAAGAVSDATEDPRGYRNEFLDVARQAQDLLKGE